MYDRATLRDGKGGVRRIASLLAVALAFVFSQTLVLAHANSHEAQAPGHNKQACALHINGDRPASALAPDVVEVLATRDPVFDLTTPKTPAPVDGADAAFYVRGPPAFA